MANSAFSRLVGCLQSCIKTPKCFAPAALATLVLTPPAFAGPQIAIIIDDLGYQLAAGKRAIELPGPVTFAVLPGTPRGAELASYANQRGKDVILHLPLQAVDHDGPAEPDGITLDTSRERFRQTFERALASVPHAIGVSSHRGSLLTRHPGHMGWLMEELQTRGDLFFVDSYTTAASVALNVADEFGVSAVRRDVFLDHNPDEQAIRAELRRLVRIAQTRGVAIGIGHPYPETLRVLEAELPELQRQGIELVALREVLTDSRRQNPTKAQTNRNDGPEYHYEHTHKHYREYGHDPR